MPILCSRPGQYFSRYHLIRPRISCTSVCRRYGGFFWSQTSTHTSYAPTSLAQHNVQGRWGRFFGLNNTLLAPASLAPMCTRDAGAFFGLFSLQPLTGTPYILSRHPLHTAGTCPLPAPVNPTPNFPPAESLPAPSNFPPAKYL